MSRFPLASARTKDRYLPITVHPNRAKNDTYLQGQIFRYTEENTSIQTGRNRLQEYCLS